MKGHLSFQYRFLIEDTQAGMTMTLSDTDLIMMYWRNTFLGYMTGNYISDITLKAFLMPLSLKI